MKNVSHDDLKEIVINSGISSDNIKNTSDTLEISLARLTAKSDEGYIVLDKNNRLELEESLRIGANISHKDAENVLVKLTNKILELNDAEVNFLSNFKLDVNKGNIKFEIKDEE